MVLDHMNQSLAHAKGISQMFCSIIISELYIINIPRDFFFPATQMMHFSVVI